jgi:hypothetical protein
LFVSDRQGLSADASAEEKESTLRELVALHRTLGSYAASAGLFIPQLAAPVGSVTLKKVDTRHQHHPD